ncbi:MAG TPA: oligopeptide ABC transporter permease [Virgibacillus sp.]|nr:oligopeptide ABC transporter permease [Virgibacillus sp.]
MFKYILRRVGYMAIAMFIIATATFFLMKTLPGSPLNDTADLTAEQEAMLEAQYGLDEPVAVQYVKYMGGLLKGDMGTSFQFSNTPVNKILMDRFGPSLQLGFQALIIGTVLGILLGMLAAVFHNGSLDYSSTILAVLGTSIPSFVFAGLLQWIFAINLGWFPIAFWKGPLYSVLPTIALMIFPLATAARFVRTEMLEVLGSDFITTARAKGVGKYRVVFKHGLRNALIPLITVMGPMVVSLLTGTLVIEEIFAIPGVGEQFVSSIMVNDYPTIMGTTLILAFLFIVVILIVDLLYGLIDPRIRVTEEGKD